MISIVFKTGCTSVNKINWSLSCVVTGLTGVGNRIIEKFTFFKIKEPDLHFTVAKALGDVALGPMSSAGRSKWRLKKSSQNSGTYFEALCALHGP